ncbi:hypothetical protein IFM89_009181 [Coptis chinensis]|uniref:Uncharacterized protein n=1 Tax=Coptis chinensis TaxID=261450 RepID=A0A835IW16_9MAGN|nr:hypothetical protein IFM89_009181 [Coptis chinensis]
MTILPSFPLAPSTSRESSVVINWDVLENFGKLRIEDVNEPNINNASDFRETDWNGLPHWPDINWVSELVAEVRERDGRKLNDAYQNIFLETGISPLNCQIGAWNLQDKSSLCSYCIIESHEIDSDDNNDICGTCEDVNELLCCHGCPSTYYQSGMDVEVLPQGVGSTQIACADSVEDLNMNQLAR